MKTFLLLITLLITSIAFAQNDSIEKEPILSIVEQMPKFIGGDNAMAKFIQKNIKPPNHVNGGGTCFITFVVEKDGSITNVAVLRGAKDCPQCDEEALRVVKLMPNWSPGEQNGRKVRTQYNLPLKFTL